MDFIAVLTSARHLREAVAGLSAAQLDDVIGKLQRIRDEKRMTEQMNAEKQKARREALDAILSIMAENRLTAGDLTLLAERAAQEKPPRRRRVPPKYRFRDAAGNVLTWTGQGRTPLAFRECMAREGRPAEAYLVGAEPDDPAGS